MPYVTAKCLLITKARCLFLLCFLPLVTFLSDAPRALGQEYVFRVYRQIAGLGNLAVNSIAADRQGFLWVATENGIYRFLGSGFQRFGTAQGIAEPYMTQVFVAADGTLWAASDQNLYRWTGQAFQFAASQPIKMSHSSSLASEGAGSLLVITLGKLYHLRYSLDGGDRTPGRMEPFFSPDQIAAHPSLVHLGAIAALPDGTIWMACAKMLCSWKPGLQHGVLTEWAEPQGVPPDLYRSVLQDRKGILWAVSLKHIVALLPGTSNHPHRAFVDRSIPQAAGNGVYSRLPIACDPTGRVVVSIAGGIARWDGSSWQTVGKANGFTSTHITSLLFDERGNLWMGAIGNGLYHWLGYADWQGWIDNQGLPSSDIWAIGPFSRGRVWIGTEKGLAILDTRSGLVTEPRFAKDWPYGQVTGIIAAPNDLALSLDLDALDANGDPSGGTLLVATLPGKVLKVEGHPARVTLIADLQDFTYQFLRDPSGRTFLISDPGIFDVSGVFDTRSLPSPESRLSALSPLAPIAALLGPRAYTNKACLEAKRAGRNRFIFGHLASGALP